MTKSLERIFLLLSIFFGLLFVFFTPPFQAPDEYSHFFRAFEISEGYFLSQRVFLDPDTKYVDFNRGLESSDFVIGNYVPSGLVHVMENVSNDLSSNTEVKQNPSRIFQYIFFRNGMKDKVLAHFPGSALYSPISYIPQSLSILVTRILHVPYLSMFYIARITNLTAYIMLVYWSLRILKSFKLPILIMGVMPMSLFLAGSVNPDALLIGLSVFIFSLAHSIGMGYLKNTRFKYLFLLASIMLGGIKLAYFLIPGVLLAYGKKHRVLALLGLVGAIFTAIGWQYISSKLYIPLRVGVDPYLQRDFIFQNPFEYLTIVKNSIIGNRSYIFTQMVGNFGWLDTPLNIEFVVFYLILLVLSTILDKRAKIRLSVRAFSILVGALIGLVIITLMYMSWTPVGNNEVYGVAGKNFLPILPLLLSPFYGLLNIRPGKLIGSIILLTLPLSLVYSLYMLISRFYYIDQLLAIIPYTDLKTWVNSWSLLDLIKKRP